MQKRVKPVSLRPMPKEQKIWLVATIVLFVVFASVGWYFTVARAIEKSFRASHQELSGQFNQTKDVFVGDQDLGKKTQETTDKLKSFFQNVSDQITQRKQVEQAAIENVKEQMKQSSTH